MFYAPSRPLILPVGTVEKLEIPDVEIGGHPDPTSLPVETLLSAEASIPSQGDAIDLDGFIPAEWLDETTVQTALLSGVAAGDYGLWVKVIANDENIIRYAGRVIFT
jgi:hypothetical protein